VGLQAKRFASRCMLSHVGLFSTALFQFHEEQDENCPHPNGYWKLRRLCISQK
jgi:hypothetical protein